MTILPGLYRATVADNLDPFLQERVRLLIPQLFGNRPTTWAEPVPAVNVEVPAIGDEVWVAFQNGNSSYPLYISSPNTSLGDITALDARLDILEGQTLNTRLTAAEGSITSQGGRITTLEGYNASTRLSSLESSRTTDEADISSLKSSRTTDEATLGTAVTDISSLKSSRTTDEADISSLKSSRTTDEGRLTTLEGYSAGTRLTSLESSRTTDEADISSLKSSRTADESTLSSHTTELADHETRVGNLEAGRPWCFVSQTTPQTGWSTGTFNAVTFDNEIGESGTFHSNSTNPSRIVIGGKLGWWRVNGLYVSPSNAAMTFQRASIARNGTRVPGAQVSSTSSSSSILSIATGTVYIQATSSSDYVELQGWMTAASGTLGTSVSSDTASGLTAEWVHT